MRRPTRPHRVVIAGSVVLVAVAIAIAVASRSRPDEDVASGPTTSTCTTSSSPTTAGPAGTTSTTTTHPPTSTSTRPPSTSATTTNGTGPPPTTVSPAPAVVVSRGNPSRREVALTFDCGSDAGSTTAILDRLRDNGIVATFGVTGAFADAHPDLVRRMVDEGHQLVNHSYDHPSFTGRSTGAGPLTRAQRLEQLAAAEAAIRRAAGVTTQPWFRPPYGDEDASVRADVALAGYRYELMWTVDSLGWRGVPPDQVVQRCLEQAVPGAIYLFHVGAASTDHLALQAIIDGLRARGYGFVTAAALIR